MRYGPRTVELGTFPAWLAEADTARVTSVLAHDPKPYGDDRRAAMKRRMAAGGLGASWVKALEKDRAAIFGTLLADGVFPDDDARNDFRSLVMTAEKAIMQQDHLAPGDLALLVQPFADSGMPSVEAASADA